jgi:putative addiction module component (TIGR02574 family)
MQALGIDRLSLVDRIALASELWDSIASECPTELTDDQRAELRRRAAVVDSNPDDFVSWDEVRRDALRRFGS